MSMIAMSGVRALAMQPSPQTAAAAISIRRKPRRRDNAPVAAPATIEPI